MALEEASFGEIYIENKKLKSWLKENKSAISIVFQDYRSSINPNFKIIEALQEPYWQKKQQITLKQIEELLTQVELPSWVLNSYIHELSGGQVQRVCIARALLSNPQILILDEALNALDIYTQTQIIKLLKKLQKEKNLTYFFITHDLESASALCEEIAVLYKGNIVETLNINNLKNAKHFYTKALIQAVIHI